MIANHQGAIDMTKVLLQYGDDPWTKEVPKRPSTPSRRKSKR
jgi:uncharacterized protein (DUF305 family)